MKVSEWLAELVEILKNFKLLWVMLFASLSYTGVNEYQSRQVAQKPPVIPQITVPKPVPEPISCKCIDYAPKIDKAVRDAERRHSDSLHGGS